VKTIDKNNTKREERMSKHQESQYLNLLEKVLEQGTPSDDRTGNGTLSLFGEQMRFKIYPQFPLLTTKRVYWKGIVHELLWFLKGDTNIKYLVGNRVNIWNDDAYRHYVDLHKKKEIGPVKPLSKNDFIHKIREGAKPLGYLGPVYGAQWRGWFRNYDGVQDIQIDQIDNLIQSIKTNPSSRRHILSAWNVAELDRMALVPCHMMAQFYVRAGKLSCHMYQRSADLFLGMPFNIASYAMLTYMIAQVTNLEPNELVISIGDAHIYNGHIEAVKKQLVREPKHWPTVTLDPTITSIDGFRFEDIRLFDYNPHKTIKAPLFT
jgi:thymidylate synthase